MKLLKEKSFEMMVNYGKKMREWEIVEKPSIACVSSLDLLRSVGAS